MNAIEITAPLVRDALDGWGSDIYYLRGDLGCVQVRVHLPAHDSEQLLLDHDALARLHADLGHDVEATAQVLTALLRWELELVSA